MIRLDRSEVLLEVVRPALKELGFLRAKLDSHLAELMLMAIGEQENDDWQHPVQIVKRGGKLLYAPNIARGWWQFERMGAVIGVMEHDATSSLARMVCKQHSIEFNSVDIHDALAWDQHFAAKMARLNLLWLPRALPGIGQVHEALDQYLETWRPGAFQRDPTGVRAKWVELSYPTALATCRENPRS